MPDTPTCLGSLQVCAIRAALLDPTGVPLPGAGNGYAADSVLTFDLGLDIEKAEDKTKRNGCGRLVMTFHGDDQIKGATVKTAMTELDLVVAQILANCESIVTLAGSITGFQLPKLSTPLPDGACLELWSKAWDGASQATLDGELAWWHWVLPKTKNNIGATKLSDDFLDFGIEGYAYENANMTHHGPFGDWPDEVVALGGITSCAGVFLDTFIPDTDCEYIEVPVVTS